MQHGDNSYVQFNTTRRKIRLFNRKSNFWPCLSCCYRILMPRMYNDETMNINTLLLTTMKYVVVWKNTNIDNLPQIKKGNEKYRKKLQHFSGELTLTGHGIDSAHPI